MNQGNLEEKEFSLKGTQGGSEVTQHPQRKLHVAAASKAKGKEKAKAKVVVSKAVKTKAFKQRLHRKAEIHYLKSKANVLMNELESWRVRELERESKMTVWEAEARSQSRRCNAAEKERQALLSAVSMHHTMFQNIHQLFEKYQDYMSETMRMFSVEQKPCGHRPLPVKKTQRHAWMHRIADRVNNRVSEVLIQTNLFDVVEPVHLAVVSDGSIQVIWHERFRDVPFKRLAFYAWFTLTNEKKKNDCSQPSSIIGRQMIEYIDPDTRLMRFLYTATKDHSTLAAVVFVEKAIIKRFVESHQIVIVHQSLHKQDDEDDVASLPQKQHQVIQTTFYVFSQDFSDDEEHRHTKVRIVCHFDHLEEMNAQHLGATATDMEHSFLHSIALKSVEEFHAALLESISSSDPVNCF